MDSPTIAAVTHESMMSAVNVSLMAKGSPVSVTSMETAIPVAASLKSVEDKVNVLATPSKVTAAESGAIVGVVVSG